MLERLWTHDPAGLFAKDKLYKFVPQPYMDIPTAMNSLVRFTVYFSVLAAIASRDVRYFLLIPAVLVFTVLAVNLFPNPRALEAFTESVSRQVNKYTMPTGKNPFMNPLLTEIHDNPDRADAAPISSNAVKREVEKAFQETTDLYMDTSDKFDMAQSMRTFHTIQSATIPSDQDGFLKFLAKGVDEPDNSSAFPARNAKAKSEGYVESLGSMKNLPNTTAKPTGVTPKGTAKGL
jgi:hypothetical protein